MFFEKFDWPPILTPGEPPNQNFGMPVVGVVRIRATPTSFWLANTSGADSRGASDESLASGECVHVRVRFNGRCSFQDRRGKPAATKKKGGAINAPPLEGSDTSVSSPKRQTAEAVRCDIHAKLTLSQAGSCVHVT